MAYTKPGPDPTCNCGICRKCRHRKIAREWANRAYRDSPEFKEMRRATNARRDRRLRPDFTL
jgi:hypothetical protein